MCSSLRLDARFKKKISAVIDFRRENLTSEADPRIKRIKHIYKRRELTKTLMMISN